MAKDSTQNESPDFENIKQQLVHMQAQLAELSNTQISFIEIMQSKLTDIGVALTQRNNLSTITTELEKLSQSQLTLRDIYKAQSVAHIHNKTFGPYKNIHPGRDIVLVATGPTLNDYKPIEGAIHVGVNKAFMRQDFELDYMFLQDYYWGRPYTDAFCQHTNSKNPKKFLGIVPDEFTESGIPESLAFKYGFDRYYVGHPDDTIKIPTRDIANQILWGTHTVASSAMQFIFWTNPAKIYLVGCDSNSGGHFDNATANNYNSFTVDQILKCWASIKDFSKKYHPDTQIISINPVGLKGLFEDIYSS